MKEKPVQVVANKLEKLPRRSGVYLWKDTKGGVIYVGKAKVLAHRVRSYFHDMMGKDIKTRLLITSIRDLDWIVTDTEKEALILENNLIKKYRPRYNIRLRDDKNYPCLRLSNEEFPKLSVVRRIKKDGATYYGPFSSSSAVKTTLLFLNRNFPLRKCTDKKFSRRTRPCLMHQIGQCEAPCVDRITQEEYAKIVRQVSMFFEGRSDLLIREMNTTMERAAEELEFEKAARLRDAIAAIRMTVEKQNAASADFVPRDIFGLYREGGSSVVSVLYLRNGAILGHRAMPTSGMELPDREVIASVIKQYYARDNVIPDEVVLGAWLGEESKLIEQWLSEQAGKKVKLVVPVRGRKKDLLSLAEKNARSQFDIRREQIRDTQGVLEKIQQRLSLSNLPVRIECFDISNLQGAHQVASQVLFVEGEPDKTGYRHYRVKTVAGQDDFASMREVLFRRFSKSRDDSPWPDLLMIDGGKGQLNIARAVLAELDIDGPDMVGFTKVRKHESDQPEDMAYLPGRKNPVLFRRGGDDLFLLQRVRDESHRFAIEYHRNLRQKDQRKSALDSIPGVGPGRKKALLRHFGSVKRIAAATEQDVAEVRGISKALAKSIHDALTEPDRD